VASGLRLAKLATMDIEHRVGFHAPDDRIVAMWAKLGFEVSQGFNVVVVRESHPRWGQVSTLIANTRRWSDVAYALFDSAEIDSADTLGVGAAWHHGYPQPESDFGYLKATYDLQAYCPRCGGGKTQRAPFRMRSEPNWECRSILQLNWVFDEYFVTPRLWEDLFKPFGVEAREVLSARGRTPLSTVVQLVVPDVVDLDMPTLPFEDCEACSRRKYLPVATDFLPRSNSPVPVMAKSAQSFGSGHSSWNLVLCAQALRQSLLKAGAEGVDFQPCRS
jgi:hypothetical protein